MINETQNVATPTNWNIRPPATAAAWMVRRMRGGDLCAGSGVVSKVPGPERGNTMGNLEFSQPKHIYRLNGEVLPSVSDLCRFLHREVYKDAPAWKMEDAAIRGDAVHACAQQLDTCGTATISGDYAPYLKAYELFLLEHTVKWAMVEMPLYHPQELYAGTIDRYGFLDGFYTLLDIKTTYTVYKPLCRAQLNLYRLMLIAKGLPVDKMYILHLKKDGTYKLIRFKEDLPLANSLITLHNALRKRRRKGAKNV